MVSAVVLTRNEEKNIEECLKSLAWCDEIVVVDDYSEDGTLAKCQSSKLKCQIFQRHLNDDFATQRNFGLGKAKGEWVLFVDGDERISEALASEINQKSKIKNQKVNGYFFKRRDFMWGRELKYGETGNVRLLRLAKKDAGKWRRRVHEVWEVSGTVGTLKNPLLHYPHQSLREFIDDVDRMSTMHAQALKEQGVRSNVLKIIIFPPAKFFHNWIFKLGCLDGTPGFLVAAVMSFHSFLGWSKLWKR